MSSLPILSGCQLYHIDVDRISVSVTTPKLGRTPLLAWFRFWRENMQVQMCDWFRCQVTETVDCCLEYLHFIAHAFSILHDELTWSQHLWHGFSYPEWSAGNGLTSVLMTAGEPALSGCPVVKCRRLFGVMLHSPQLSRLMDICSQPQQLAETSTANAREALTPASDYMIAIPCVGGALVCTRTE